MREFRLNIQNRAIGGSIEKKLVEWNTSKELLLVIFILPSLETHSAA